MPRLTPAIALLALAGTAPFAMLAHAEPAEPISQVEAEASAADLEAVEAWIETPLGQAIVESLPTDPSFAPHRRLASLLAMPRFHEWSQSLSGTKLPHFEAYLKHMLEAAHCQDIVRREMSEYTDLNATGDDAGIDEEDAANRQFVITVMTDLGYLASLTDEQVTEIEETGRAMQIESITAFTDILADWAEAENLGDETVTLLKRSFARHYEEITRIFRNPAAAMAFQPYTLQAKDDIRDAADSVWRDLLWWELHTMLRSARRDEARFQESIQQEINSLVFSAAHHLRFRLPLEPPLFHVARNRDEQDEFDHLTQRFSHFADVEFESRATTQYPGYRAGREIIFPRYFIDDSDQDLGIPFSESPIVTSILPLLHSGEPASPHPLINAQSDWFKTQIGRVVAAYLPHGYENPVESLLGELLELEEFRRVTAAIEADEMKRGYLIDYINTVLPRWAWDEADRPRLVVHTVMTDLLHFESLDTAAIEPLLTKRAAQIETLAQIRRDRLHDLFAPLDLEEADRERLSRFFEIGMADLNEVAQNPAFLASARPLTKDEMTEAKSYVIESWDSDLSRLERALEDFKKLQDSKEVWAQRMGEELVESRHHMQYSRIVGACDSLVMMSIAETAQAVMKPTIQPPLPESFHAWAPSRSAEASMTNVVNNGNYSLDIVPTIVPLGF